MLPDTPIVRHALLASLVTVPAWLSVLMPSVAMAATKKVTPPEFEQTARRTVEKWLIPTYQQFIDRADSFDTAVTSLCPAATSGGKAPQAKDGNLGVARQALKELQRSWAAASIIKFGPIGKETRLHRIYFWPDKHGTGARQFRKALAAKDYSQLKPKAFAQQSAALQGLGPAEKLLYPGDALWTSGKTEDAETRAFACGMLHAIAANLKAIGSETISAWQQRLANPAPQKAAVSADKYDNRDELYYKFIKALIDEAELSSFVRLGKPMGLSPEKAKPKLAEAYRQQLSIPLLKASLTALQSLLLGEGKDFKGLAQPFATTNLRANAEQRFQRSHTALDAINGPLDQAVVKDWTSVQQARYALNDLVTYLTETIALKAGIVFTFNALDGD